jgi:phosphatidylglycerophosphatase A
MQRLGLLVATCGPLGYIPVAPGTAGSAAGLVLFALVRAAGSAALEAIVLIGLFAGGVWASAIAERELGDVDPPPVVVDEVAGMLITLAFVPITIWGAVVGFLIFRLLDVVKPWPSGRLEFLPGGWGVMADDGIAAVYSNIALRFLVVLAPAGWLA